MFTRYTSFFPLSFSGSNAQDRLAFSTTPTVAHGFRSPLVHLYRWIGPLDRDLSPSVGFTPYDPTEGQQPFYDVCSTNSRKLLPLTVRCRSTEAVSAVSAASKCTFTKRYSRPQIFLLRGVPDCNVLPFFLPCHPPAELYLLIEWLYPSL